jgi:two-component system, sensor histidine kinase PdtaS
VSIYSQPGLLQTGIPNDSAQVKELLAQSEEQIRTNPDAGVQAAQKALALSEKTNYKTGIAKSNAAIGHAFFAKRDYVSAVYYFERALPPLKETGKEDAEGQVYKMLGDCYSKRTFFRQAIENYRTASVLLRKTGQLKLFSDCQDALANLSLEFGQSRNALPLYFRSLNVKKELYDSKGILITTSKISKAYLFLKQYDSALYFNKEVQRLAAGDEEIFTDAMMDEIVIDCFLKDWEKAAAARSRAEKLLQHQNNPSAKIKLHAATATYYLAQNDKVNFTKYFDSAAAMMNGTRNPEPAITGLNYLAEISGVNGDYKTAFNMLKTMDRYKDIFRTESMQRIGAEIENAKEAAYKENQIQLLNRLNNLNIEKLTKEELLRLSVQRENILKDSSILSQQLLMAALENESGLRNRQLIKEKELSLSLSRENELKQQLLNDERNNRNILLLGLSVMTLLGGIIFYQFKKQQKKNSIINKQSAELEVLNKEIHHRVKNNLQVISSMLDLQSQSLNDERATAIIKEGIQRVQSMAFIHQNLYQGNAVNSVNMNEYIKMLSNHLFQTYNIRTDKIKLHTQIEDLNLHTDTAIPLGMILNELISNALKYAFKERESGEVWVTMKKTDNELLLQVKDNGVGLNKDFNPDNTSSFGYEIIKAFLQKMKARMNIEGSNGTDVQIIISKFKTIS